MRPSFDSHRPRRNLFGDDVACYDEGRPGYPEELYDLLVRVADVGPASRLLEIGPGTGQATGRLLDLGAEVTAVELHPKLADRLVSNHPGRGLTVLVDSFENVDLPAASFDVVAAATSFHWVPAVVGLARAGEVVRPGGWIALWWNVFGDPDRPDPFHESLQPILERHAPELVAEPGAGSPGTGAHPHALDVAGRVAEIDASGRFGPVVHELIRWAGHHTAAEIRRMFATFSPWLALDPRRREIVLDELEALALLEFEDHVERPYLTAAYLARRRAG